MKHYIVFYEDRMFMVFAKDPKTAIYTIINNFELDKNDFKLFKARSVGSLTSEYGNCFEFRTEETE